MTAIEAKGTAVPEGRRLTAPLRGREMALAALGFLMLALVWTWPLCLDLGGQVPAGATDVWQNYWNCWWWGHALGELGQGPLHTHHLFHPYGAPLILHTHSALNMILTLPVRWLWGAAAALNLATLAGFALGGWGAFVLGRDLGLSTVASLLAGIVFAFCPNHTEQSLEHLNLATIQFLPLVLLFLLRWLRDARWEWALAMGLAFGLQGLGCWHVGLLTAVAAGLVTLTELAARGRAHWHAPAPRRWAQLGAAGGLAFLVAAPLLVPMLLEIARGGGYVKPPEERGIDPVFLFLPSDHHPLLGRWTSGIYAAWRGYLSVGFLAYAGLVPVACAGAALALARGSQRRAACGWLAVALALLVLALGAHPTVAGRTLPGPAWPFAWLAHVPILRAMRLANRFMIPFMLLLGLLAGLGLDRACPPGARWRRRVAAPGLLALTLFEYLWLPYPVAPVPDPAWAREIRRGDAPGAVLDIPFDATSATVLNLADQVMHERPIAGGYMAYVPQRVLDALGRDPVLHALAGFAPDPGWGPVNAAELAKRGFGWVALHLDRSRERLEAACAAAAAAGDFYAARRWQPQRGVDAALLEGLTQWFEMELGAPVFRDADTVLFRIGAQEPGGREGMERMGEQEGTEGTEWKNRWKGGANATGPART